MDLIKNLPFRDFVHILLRFLRNPVKEVQNLPDWNWIELVTVHVLVTAATGALGGFLQVKFFPVLWGLIFSPILTGIMLGIGALFFYFCFQVFAGHTLPFRRLSILVFFANIPFFILQIASPWFPPIALFALAFAALILIVGLIENFKLDRKLVIRIVAGVYALFFLVWLWNSIDIDRISRDFEEDRRIPEVHLGQ